jgi:hypothetical protein
VKGEGQKMKGYGTRMTRIERIGADFLPFTFRPSPFAIKLLLTPTSQNNI